MRVVIVGAGDVGRALATRLASRRQVALLDTVGKCLDAGLRIDHPEQLSESEVETGLSCLQADGTSRLVLERLYDAELNCALVAVTGADESNLETGRLARQIGYDPVIAVQNESANAEAYREARITALDRPALLADHVERSLHHKGAVVPTGIGFERGELLEIRILATSPVLGRPLNRLAPHRWRVAAVFRGDELIVPTGNTILRTEDRVLLVGDPRILTAVGEYLRLGTPQFPRPFGPNIVTLELDGEDAEMAAEGESLARDTAAANLIRAIPGAKDTVPAQEREEPLVRPECPDDVPCRTFDPPALGSPEFTVQMTKKRAGLVLVRTKPRSFVERLLGRTGRNAELCDRLQVPVLFSRSRYPYRRVVLPLLDPRIDLSAAELAIDLTRQLALSITAIKVDLPEYITGEPDEALHDEIVPIRRLCEMYEVPLEYHHRKGNPIKETLSALRPDDLAVVARSREAADSYFRPDVALRLVRHSPCSVLVSSIAVPRS